MRALIFALILSFLPPVAQAAGASVLLPPDGGQINVRDLGAMGDGVTDDTAAFRAALKDEADGYRCIYIPKGTYLLSDLVGWRCRRTLLGEDRDGVVLKLKNACPGYGDPTKPKPVIQSAMAGAYGGDSRANAAFDNYLINLTIDTGRGNPGAIALSHTTHNLGVVENVLLRSDDGAGVIGLDLAETEFGPGAITRLTVDGFDVGIRTSGNVSSTVFEHIVLRRQKVMGMQINHAVSMRGLQSDNAVPAIVVSASWMAQLVLVDASLTGGSANAAAIDSQGQVNLRNITTNGYGMALKDRQRLTAGPAIASYFRDQAHSVFPALSQHLALPIEDPPAIAVEPVAKWLILEPKGKEDMTAELQKALDSDAQTIFFKPGNYQISDTLRVGGTVRRLVTLMGGCGGGLGGNIEKVGRDKPFLRIAGDASQPPLSIEGLGFGAWPHMPLAIELASPRTVYMKYVRCGHPGAYLRSTDAAKGGKLFMDEMPTLLDLAPGLSVWIRQSNPENNPYGPGKALLSYIVNRGSTVWVLGLKTEAPAIHAITLAGGKTEILGGFFRDHVGFNETAKKLPLSYPGLPELPAAIMPLLQQGVPAFITVDSQLTASYVQYAWAPGTARALQAIEMRGNEVKELRVEPNNQTIGLYSALPRQATDVAIDRFAADQAQLRKGQPCVLSWSVRNAKAVTITPGIGTVPASGSRTLIPDATTTWTLRAEGPGGPAEAEIGVQLYRAADQPGRTLPGLARAVYAGTWPTLPDLTTLTPLARDVAAQADLTGVTQSVDFGLEFTGFLTVPTDGEWTFSTASDDGSVLWIGDQKVVDNDGLHGVTERNGRLPLEAGAHAVRLRYMQGAGGASLQVSWAGPGLTTQVVPAAAWIHRP